MSFPATLLSVFIFGAVVGAAVPRRWVPAAAIAPIAGSAVWWYFATAADRATYDGGDCNACIGVLVAVFYFVVAEIGLIVGIGTALWRGRRRTQA